MSISPSLPRTRLPFPAPDPESPRHRSPRPPATPEADAAEARGDAAAALAVLDRPPAESGAPSSRVDCLRQLVALGPLLPGWVTSRWVLAQASRSRHRDLAARRTLAAEVAADLRVPAEAWVARQLLLHELGGLEHFVGRVASLDLLARADSIDAWVGAPMRGYRLVGRTPRTVLWRDVGTGTDHTTDDIGSAVSIRLGDHVIGRLVPATGRMMLESRPLPVSPGTAWRVALRPEDWLDVLGRLGAAGSAEPATHGDPGGGRTAARRTEGDVARRRRRATRDPRRAGDPGARPRAAGGELRGRRPTLAEPRGGPARARSRRGAAQRRIRLTPGPRSTGRPAARSGCRRLPRPGRASGRRGLRRAVGRTVTQATPRSWISVGDAAGSAGMVEGYA